MQRGCDCAVIFFLFFLSFAGVSEAAGALAGAAW